MRRLKHAYLTNGQLIARSDQHKEHRRLFEVQLFNASKKLARMLKNLSLTKRAIVLMSKNDIPGVRRVLERALERGESPHVVLSKLQDALSGLHKARRWSEKEKDLALLVLRLGGPALLHVLHQTSGLPGLTFTRKLGRKVRSVRFFPRWMQVRLDIHGGGCPVFCCVVRVSRAGYCA